MGNMRMIKITVLVMDNDAGVVVDILPTEEEAIKMLYEKCGGKDKDATLKEMETFLNAHFGEDEEGRAIIKTGEIEVEE